VASILKSPSIHPTTVFSSTTIKDGYHLAGSTTVLNMHDKTPVTILITRRAVDDKISFLAYRSGISKPVGFLLLRLPKPEPVESAGWDLPYPRLHGIWEDLIHSLDKEHLKGVGTALTQVAIEEAFRHGFDGRVELDACGNSHGFHYSQGFRVVEDLSTQRTPANASYVNDIRDSLGKKMEELRAAAEKENRADNYIKVAFAKAKEVKTNPNTESPSGILMYLPSHAIHRWKKIIGQNPILH
jgi:hypothetical protein